VSTTVTVNALPIVGVITGTNSICVGKTSQLNNTTSGGVWSSSNASVASVSSTGLLSGLSAGTSVIKYVVTNASGCVDSVSTTVTVNALPIVGPISGTTAICVGNTSQLSNTTSGGVWSSSNASVVTVSGSGLITSIGAGTSTIKYVVTNGSGCIDSVSTTVTVNSLPVIANISGASAICVGKTVQLADATIGGTWSSANTTIATVNSISGIVTGKSAGVATIWYSVTNGSGCIDSVSTTVTVNALPIVGAITGTNSICVGKTSQLSNTTSGGVWSSSNASVATVSGSGLITATGAGTTSIKYVVTNGSGCVDSISTTVTVNALPVVGTISGTTAVCVGKTSQLSNTTSGGVWSSSNASVATVSGSGLITAIGAGTTSIKYVVTNGSGCVDSISTTVTVNTTPTPTVSSNSPVKEGETIQLAASDISGASYSWNGPASFVSTVQNPSILAATVAMSGDYSVIATLNGCSSAAATVNVLVNALPTNLVIAGNVINPLGTPIPGVTVSLSGSASQVAKTISSNNSNYSFTVAPDGDYTVALSKNNDSLKSNGVTTIDIALVKSHILNKTLLNTPYKMMAADVNNSGSIDLLDIVYMKRLILNIDTTFSGSRLWNFVDSNYTFANPANPFPITSPVSFTKLQKSTQQQSFIGVKLGDVNFDWINTVASQSIRKAPVEFFYDTVNVAEASNYITVPIRVKRVNNLMGMQFTLNFNSQKLNFVGINNNVLGVDYGTTKAANGHVSFIWNDALNEAKTLADGSVLFELVLQKNADFDVEDISINSKVTPIEAFDNQFNVFGIVKTTGAIVSKKAILPTVKEGIMQLLPNPTKGIVHLKINAAQNKNVYFEVVDIAGKVLFAQKASVFTGTQTISLNLKQTNQVASGTYFLRTTGLANSPVKQIIVE
jgi:uncharacterized protein YjdB